MRPLTHFSIHILDFCNYNCPSCGHFAPLLKDRIYEPEIFVPFLKRMREAEYLDEFTEIRLNGGEPFLHPRLHHWVRSIKEVTGSKVGIFTNGFWLRSQDDLERYRHILSEISFLLITQYPGRLTKDSLLLGLVEIVPELILPVRDSFCTFQTTDVNRPRKRCGFGTNPHLMPDGKMMMCPTGYSLFCNQASANFSLSKDLFFDLRPEWTGNHAARFDAWINKKMPDCCGFCRKKWSSHAFPTPLE